MKKTKLILGGVAVGVINALFGAGGGMIAVELLSKSGLSQKEAQATAVCVILPLTVVTGAVYYFQGNINFHDALPYLLPGAIGAVFGSLILKKIPDRILRKVFAVFLIWAGARLVFK